MDVSSLLFYEIYPTSYKDSNGDGIGDLNGITSKLDYISDMGFNAIWINPFYLSPFKDGGYDVKDFFKIDPRFGNDDDFKKLIEKADSLGIKIFVDLVAGHASEENELFLKSAEPNRNEYSDLFIWNNSVWENEEGLRFISGRFDRDACFMVNFFSTQPAFNYGFNQITNDKWQISYKDERTFKTRQYLISIIKYWLSKGVSGFRVDMAESLVKKDKDKTATIEVWNYIFAEVKKDYPDCAFVSEWSHPERSFRAGFDMDFILDHYDNFFINMLRTKEKNIFHGGELEFFKENLKWHLDMAKKYNKKLAWISGNHDVIRAAHFVSEKEFRTFLMMIYTFPGVPFIYYGDEIGMKGPVLTSKDGGYARTGARTPMQWNKGKNAGFSTTDGQLYLPVFGGNEANVEEQINNPDSLLNYLKELIKFRKSQPCILNNECSFEEKDRILKVYRDELTLIVNLSNEDYKYDNTNVLFGTDTGVLRPNEAVIIKR